MKRQNEKLSLNKLKISKLNNLSFINGGDGGDDDDGTIRSRIPTRCKPGNGNGNGFGDIVEG